MAQPSLRLRSLAWAGRHWPLYAGHSRIADLPFVRAAFAGAGPDLPVRLRCGVEIRVDPSDYNGLLLALFGTVEPGIVAVCRALLRPGDCFLDIGANYGAVGLACADVVGPGGAVHLFEPQPDLCRRIRDCLAAGSLPWVQLHEMGLLDSDGEVEIRVDPHHTGTASMVRGAGGGVAVRVPVRRARTTLAPLVEERGFGVKLDVEGVEPILVRELLAVPGLRFAVFESYEAVERSAIWESFRGGGFEVFGLPNRALAASVEHLSQLAAMGDFNDFLAVRLPPGRSGRSTSAAGLARALG